MLESNQHPVNLLAAEKLKALHLNPYQGQLSLHQLMMHFLMTGEHGLTSGQAGQLEDQLTELDLDDPESLMQWMKVDETLDAEELKDLEPVELAQVALQTLHLETAEQSPSYQQGM